MIKLYRKIRYNLMEKNNTGKYLKYAIGEIILVMIGILLALQINNWNEQRRDRIKEQVILKQLKEDYQANLKQLKQKIDMRKTIIKSALNIFKAMDYPNEIIRDSLIKDIGTINDDPTFDPIQNDLTSSGNLRLITNVQLKRLLSNWSSDIVALTEVERNWAQMVNQQMEYVIANLGISRDVANSWMNSSDHLWLLDGNTNSAKTIIGNSKYSASIIEITSSRELEGLVSCAISYNKPANIVSKALVKRINDIINLIDNEIIE